LRSAERVSPAGSVTSAWIEYWKVGWASSGADRSGVATNEIEKAPSTPVSVVPCAISWLATGRGCIHADRQLHQAGYSTSRTTRQRTSAPSTPPPVYARALPVNDTSASRRAADLGSSSVT